MSATGRRAELVRIMRARREDIIPNLANEVDVSTRTIERDLVTLNLEGYHFETKQGNGGGVIFHEDSNPHRRILSQAHKNLLTELAGQQIEEDKAKLLYEILVYA